MTEYDQQLADWKRKQGVPAAAQELPAMDQKMIMEDAKRRGKDYCMLCGGEFRIRQMRLITRTIDPYLQFDEGHHEDGYIDNESRVRACRACFDNRYGEPVNFGPCQYCEYEPTSCFTGSPGTMAPTCNLCDQRLMAIAGLLRMPDFYVI